MKREVLFSTVHGSHLYGTAHSGSDRDMFTVVTRLPHVSHNAKSKYAKQTIKSGLDETVVDLSTFMNGCWKGVPQYLEAMFSDKAVYDRLGTFRHSFRVGSSVLPTYLRTMKAFAYDERDGGVKKRRHALRLGLNAREISLHGRFNPTMTEDIGQRLWEAAQSPDGDKCLDLACRLMYGSATI